MTSLSIVQHGILADGTSLTKVGNTLSVKDNGVGKAKLNADIVGITTATGKVNNINTTNFTSLDGVNLTNTGDLVKIETVNLSGGADKVLDSSALTLTPYKSVLVVWRGSIATAGEDLKLRFNDDAGANYQVSHVQQETDAHANATSQNEIIIGEGLVTTSGGHFIVTCGSADEHTVHGSGGGASSKAFVGVWSDASAITKISLISITNNMNTETEMTIYGIK